MARELSADEVVWRCPEDWVPWSSSDELEPATTIVGQERAVTAIEFGLGMRGVGYNVFVTGLSGTGRLTTITKYLDGLPKDGTPPPDVVFVFNFRAPEEPRALRLAAGAGRRLRDGMSALVSQLGEGLPRAMEDKELRERMERAVGDLRQRERELLEGFDGEVREAGFALVQIQAGMVSRPEVLPVVDGKPVALEQLGALVDEGKVAKEAVEQMREVHEQLSEKLHEVFREVTALRREGQERFENVRRRVLAPILDEAVQRVRQQVADDGAAEYLDSVREDLESNLELLLADDDGSDGDRYLRWRVNLAVDNADLGGRPVVMETEPTYSNLFGTVERSLLPSGEAVTSFLRIRAGSLIRANGGFLVLNAEDLLLEPRVWPSLKRALKHRRVGIQTLESLVFGGAAMRPEAVPLDVKVVVIGDRGIYDLLFRHDSDFPKVFKVLADFDSVMVPSASSAGELLAVLRKVGLEEELPPLAGSGMRAVLEQAVRMGHWRRRFSSRFSDVADLYREAAYQAEQDGSLQVEGRHVDEARAARDRRHGLSEDRAHELIAEGVVRVETDGTAVGQVNGLAVYDLGHHRFGRPSRITASLGVGREGVINIERQAGLSGPTHDKGVNILTGFLRGLFARRAPLSMACSITFEQSYGGIDGDSASSTEIYAILSALADAPLRQDVAVTGSVDQHGRIQAIGGVNEKIEGFFRVCREAGLTGRQGVMIPPSNAADLHLGAEVVAAVESGSFHVWTVATIAEGIELLTGLPAGEPDDDGEFPDGSIHRRCQDRLEEMTRSMRRAGRDPAKVGNGGDDAAAVEADKDRPSSSDDAVRTRV